MPGEPASPGWRQLQSGDNLPTVRRGLLAFEGPFREIDELLLGVDAELLVNVAYVGGHGVLRQNERVADVRAAAALR